MRLLDLFCGAGGCAMGYYRAGFTDIVGVDIRLQKRYPFTFVLGDALDYVREHGKEFDAIHASPPCQAFTHATLWLRKRGRAYPDLIAKTRRCLKETGRPYVIEGGPGTPLVNPVKLNGAMFRMKLRRVRYFECSFPVPFHLLPDDEKSQLRPGHRVCEGDVITPVGHFSNVAYARRVMGIDWMTGAELSQAIPPAYTEYIGRYLIAFLKDEKAKC